VRANSQEYHLTPLTLVPVVVALVQKNGVKILFKGLFSIIMLNGVQLGVEQILSRLTGWTTNPPRTWYLNKDWLFHFILKISSLIITAPLYFSSVRNTVSVAVGPHTSRFPRFPQSDYPLPLWQLLLPTIAYGVIKYAFTQASLSLVAAMLYLNHCFDEEGRNSCQMVEEGIKFEDRQDIFLKATVLSSLAAEFIFYPLETVVNRLILQGTHTFTNDLDCGCSIIQIFSAHDGFLDCCDTTTWLEGKLGLYKGFGALLLQAIVYHYCINIVSFVWRYVKKYKMFS